MIRPALFFRHPEQLQTPWKGFDSGKEPDPPVRQLFHCGHKWQISNAVDDKLDGDSRE